MTSPSSNLPVGKLSMELLSELVGDLPMDSSVVVGSGIGCDVAVIDAGADGYLLLKSDPITFATDEIGHYAVTVNVNDIATSGGVPRWFLATVLLPEGSATPELVGSIMDQLKTACERYGVLLVGGHTEVTYGLDRPVLAGALVGQVARDRLVTTSGVKPGDAILLTKRVAVEGTSIIAREKRDELLAAGFDQNVVAHCAAMLHDPGICVLADSQAACAAARVHGMHDPTEGGLATALWEMATASGVGLRIEADAVPYYPETRQLCDHFGIDPLGLIASGSLLIAVDPDDAVTAIEACLSAGIECARIGTATGSAGECLIVTAGGAEPLPRYDQDQIGKLFI